MKVALVASSFLPEPGRLERRVDRLARGLASRGAEVEIITHGSGQLTLEQGELLTIRRLPRGLGPLRFGAASRLGEQLRLTSPKFDLVDVHTRHAPLALAVARARVQRLVLTPAASIDVFLGRRYGRATRALIGSATHIICRSESERELLHASVPRAAQRMHVVNDGIDAAALRAAVPFATTGIVVLSVDRLDRATSVGRAIAAIPSLGPEFRLLVIGDGPARERLAAFAADLRIASRVKFIGAVPDPVLYRWLRTARAVVTLPTERSTGLLLMEARTAGVPVVASDLPIHRQVAERLGAGRVSFVPPRASPLDVADAIEEAVRRSTISNVGLPVSGAPSWESVIDSTWAIYQQVIAGALPPEPDRAQIELVDLTSRIQAEREAVIDGVIPAAAPAGTEPANDDSWLQDRRGVNGHSNGAHRWR